MSYHAPCFPWMKAALDWIRWVSIVVTREKHQSFLTWAHCIHIHRKNYRWSPSPLRWTYGLQLISLPIEEGHSLLYSNQCSPYPNRRQILGRCSGLCSGLCGAGSLSTFKFGVPPPILCHLHRIFCLACNLSRVWGTRYVFLSTFPDNYHAILSTICGARGDGSVTHHLTQ